jgi:DNA polymerase-3 subunit gamma/tau
MENFIVSARKYRPATFESVVGQKTLTTTLRNAIKNNQLAHAYLFCGPRGVGKTTCARIFAKTINCNFLTPELEACNNCESCKAFDSNRSYNIHELDAASNNSVEDIRNLIDQVRIPPQIGTHSIYIIDEVHMLSSQAFNAFLKTLEEPPKHATFILATTEKHKILPTILSRCQIFDFNRIKVEDITEHLAYVAAKENIEYDLDGLNIIAQKADGGMRDALSFFDQIASFSGNKITYESVIENLNVLDYEFYFQLTNSFINNNITDALLLFNQILNKGFDSHNFVIGLSEHFRDLLVCKDVATLELLEVGATIRENYKKQSAECSVQFLFKALNVLNDCDLNYRNAKNKRLHVELALLKLCNITNQVSDQTIQNSQNQQINQQSNQQNQAVKKEEKTEKSEPVIQEIKTETTKTISIKDALANKNVKNVVQENSVTENNYQKIVQPELNKNFTQEELLLHWNNFAESLKDKQPRFYNALKIHLPILKEENIIEITFANESQKEAFSEMKQLIVGYFRENLQNSKIDLSIKVDASIVKNIAKPLTEREKFKILSEKNQNLTKLVQQFNLDI